jgi:uncharacterized OB-fold protein/acyl dehydratase
MSQERQAREEFERQLQAYTGLETGPPQVAEDAVNEAMIRHWCQAVSDENPIYTDPEAAGKSAHGGIVAPPAMLQAWTMPGIAAAYDIGSAKDKQAQLHALLTEHGYTGVVATNCEQGYDRYLRPGDRLSAVTVIESISEQKATALGIGYFINTRTTYTDQNGEPVGWMTFRVLKFKPGQQQAQAAPAEEAVPEKPRRLRAPRTHDNGWWWEGIDRGELLIQKCSACGALRHPPRPMCAECQSLEWESIQSAGEGTVHSYVIMHHPPIPGYDFPIAVALIDLAEGTRIISNVVGCPIEEVHVGMPVRLSIENVDEEMKLPLFRPAK